MTGERRLEGFQRLAQAVALALLLCLIPGQLTEANPGSGDEARSSGELLVRLSSGIAEEEATRFFAQHEMVIVKHISRIDVWLVTGADASPDTARAHLAQSNEVLWAELNGEVRAQGITPNDNFYQAQQWNLRLIGLPEAWVFTTGDTIPIAVIDTGIDLDHPDLAAKVWTNAGEVPGNGADDDGNGYVDDVNGWDFAYGDAIPQDENNHGSHVAGILAAHTDNTTGIAGVCWQSPIMPLQALKKDGNGNYDDVAEAIIYAADNGARVLNLSLGGEEYSQALADAVSYARSAGCIVVAAAGNDDYQPTPVLYPAALPETLAVAATTAGDEPWADSNRGPEIDVAAPGVGIFSASRSGSYYSGDGTSAATPHVSGLAALVWSLQGTLTAEQVTDVITSTIHDVYTPGWDQRTGWGRIDAQAAILHVIQPQVNLVADRASIVVGDERATLTATVTYSQGLPAPDGLTVAFLADLGSVAPALATTYGGQVTATFTSTQSGWASITASVGSDYQDVVSLEVEPYHVYLPITLWHCTTYAQVDSLMPTLITAVLENHRITDSPHNNVASLASRPKKRNSPACSCE
jgi:subtilisin family serine protease